MITMSDAVSERMQGIDKNVFVPLNEFLQSSPFSLAELRQVIDVVGNKITSKDTNGGAGQVFESYIQWVLCKFAVTSCPSLSQTRLDYGRITRKATRRGRIISYERYYETDGWGNVTVRNYDGDEITEIDALYEYDGGSSSPTPIIFEAKASKKKTHPARKMRLVSSLYESAPYFCTIRSSQKYKNPGLYIIGPWKRRIVVPASPEFSELARELHHNDTPSA